jgi:hypothetical protein
MIADPQPGRDILHQTSHGARFILLAERASHTRARFPFRKIEVAR